MQTTLFPRFAGINYLAHIVIGIFVATICCGEWKRKVDRKQQSNYRRLVTQPLFAVANFFIRRAAKDNQPITPMRLLKLVYIAHGWHLGLTHRPLIDEPVEAWRYGPVIASLYRRFKAFGNQSIPETAMVPGVELENPDRITPFLESVWQAYVSYSGVQLSTLTHQPETPWYKVWHEQDGKHEMGAEIPMPLIEEHYTRKAANA